ncbi:hypothetical protein MWE_0044 [Helicobacter pylori XZ274]|nr:hypothetical protein MWE_0044 [Helicobacter pylori XZ274]
MKNMKEYYNKAHSFKRYNTPMQKKIFLLEDDYLLSESVKESDLLKI